MLQESNKGAAPVVYFRVQFQDRRYRLVSKTMLCFRFFLAQLFSRLSAILNWDTDFIRKYFQIKLLPDEISQM